MPTNPQRALVVMLGHIGDVLVTTPVFRALKQAWPGIETTAVVNHGTQHMLTHNPDVDRLVALQRDHAGAWPMLKHQAWLLTRLRRSRFDLALDLSGNDRGAFLALASGARWRQGFAPKKKKARARVFQQLVSKRGVTDHMVEVNLRQIRALGIEPLDTRLRFFPGREAESEADRLLSGRNLAARPLALVHPTSRWMFKSWTPQGNRAVIAHLLERGFAVALTSAPDRGELDFVGQVARGLPPTHLLLNLAGRVDLKLLGALLARSSFFFGVDSAPMHMAAALGTPTVVLFGPSGEKMWGPWQVAHEVVAGDCQERPCGSDGCPGGKVSRCLVELPPDKVIAAVDRVLAGRGLA